MGSKMLIDAAHPEETRVVVVRGNRVEDFDYESASRKQLRGNIYLAKVTRVEPSLQAAFVDYGGNRHGFLAFSEIHPDYYQIPVADRKALLEEEAEEESRALAEEAEDDDKTATSRDRGRRGRRNRKTEKDSATEALEEAADSDSVSEDAEDSPLEGDGVDADAVDSAPYEEENGDVSGKTEDAANGDGVESVGSEDALEELPVRTRRRRKRQYKIQEVIKRRQIILVQVVKEERGNKGAALTTYLSLAGRYTVMMPNTARGGGISRKITNPSDRKRLRKIASDLDVAEGMGLIIRTAGASRTKTEIKRDFEYLLRLWENIRDLTLNSTAPTLVYEEGNLIKRSIRDLYNKEIDEIQVAGDEAHKEAKAFMRMLMPSHAKNVKPFKEPEPIFVHHKIERQLSAMYSPYVTLKSGGYIVLNQTEALVSIDVNSGKATREHSIEDTALKTNLEAAEEVARQLRLRDLAGLIVIDFIDMEERRNNRAVERKIKDCLRHDRARIQVGRISHFGLLEMSRQRLRTGVLEGSTNVCTICQGTGIVRSTDSVALDVLRSIEDSLMSNGLSDLRAVTSVDAALYILNHKRAMVKDIESRYSVSIFVEADKDQHGGAFTIEKIASSKAKADDSAVQIDTVFQSRPAADTEPDDEGERQRPRRRRRRGRGRGRGRSEADAGVPASEVADAAMDDVDAGDVVTADAGGDEEETAQKKPRKRGRRGGRRSRAASSREDKPAQTDPEDTTQAASDGTDAVDASGVDADKGDAAPRTARSSRSEKAPKRSRRKKPDEATTPVAAPDGDTAMENREAGDADSRSSSKGRSNGRTKPDQDTAGKASDLKADEGPAPAPSHDEGDGADADHEPRRGWWQRRA